MEKLIVLLIEDDLKDCQAIQNYVEQLDDVQLIGVSNNIERALVLTSAHLPDVVLLDLELHQGGGTGITYLSELNKLPLIKRPFILVTTNNTSEITLRYARQLGADFIMTKYNENYSAESVIEFLRSMKKIILSTPASGTIPMPLITPAQKETWLTQRIQQALDAVGISPKVLGYQYLVDAIHLYINGEVDTIPKTVAEQYHKTTSSVERAMQNAIIHTWKTADPEDLKMHYHARIRSDKGIPTLMEFISYYGRELKADSVDRSEERR